MVHTEIIKKFTELYPIAVDEIVCWFPNGKGSVRVRTKSYGDLIFTYETKKRWRIETVDSYLNSIKVTGEKR